MNDRAPDSDDTIRTLHAGRWLTLRQRGRWEYVERNNPGGAAIIVAVTPEDRLLFVEQYRVPIQQSTIEMPAGLIGDLEGQADEDALVAATRELEEETGYTCARMTHMHAGPSSSGMSTEMVHFVRAHDLRKIGDGGGDSTEDITVHAIARTEAGIWLLQKSREGFSIDPKLFAGLWLLEHERLLAD